MTRYAMAIDLSACVGCAACALACKLENQVPANNHRLWIRLSESGSFPNLTLECRPEQCLHCENPPCVPVCPTGASYQTDEGLVLVDAEKCISCGACIAACPYDARFFHSDGYVSKCSFCAHRLTEGRLPACVETCPTLCRSFGDLNDPDSDISVALNEAKRIEVLKPEMGSKPKLYYLNAPASFGLHKEEHL